MDTEAMLEGQDKLSWTAQNTTLKSAKIALKSLQKNLFSNKEIAQPYLYQIRQCHCENPLLEPLFFLSLWHTVNDYSKLQNKSFKVGESFSEYSIKSVNSPTTLV